MESLKHNQSAREKGYAALRAAVASLALLMGAPAPANAAHTPVHNEDFAVDPHMLWKAKELQRQEDQRRQEWYQQAQGTVAFLFGRLEAADAYNTIRDAFSEQDFERIKNDITEHVWNAFDDDYERPESFFAILKNKEELYSHFTTVLLQNDAASNEQRKEALSTLLTFLFTYGKGK